MAGNVTLDAYSADMAWGFGGTGIGAGIGGGAAELFNSLIANDQVRKALEAQALLDKTSVNDITALGVEDLSPVLASAEIQEEQLYLWKEVPKAPAWDLIVQGARMDRSHGNYGARGTIGTSSSGHVNDPRFTRYSQEVKYLAVKGQVTLPTQLLRQVTFRGVRDGAAMELSEEINTLTLLKLVEWGLAYFDSGVNGDEFDGIVAQIEAAATAQNGICLDLRGLPPDKDFLEQLTEISANNSARPTHLHIPNPVRRDLRQALFGQQIAMEGYSGIVGAKFDNYMLETLGGDMDTLRIRRNQMMTLGVPDGTPRYVPVTASPNAPDAPASVVAAAVAHTAGTQNPGFPGGSSYRYTVLAVGEGGWSSAVDSGTVTPSAGQRNSLTITSTDSNVQYFLIFRNLDGTTALDQTTRQFVARVAKTYPGNTTLWYDDYKHLPGTSRALYLSQRDRELRIRQLLPLLKRPLPQGLMDNSYGLLLFLCLEMPVPTHHVSIRNIGARDQAGLYGTA